MQYAETHHDAVSVFSMTGPLESLCIKHPGHCIEMYVDLSQIKNVIVDGGKCVQFELQKPFTEVSPAAQIVQVCACASFACVCLYVLVR